MQNLLANEKLIEVKELHKILPLKGISAIVKWCESVGIKIEIVGNKRVVHRFLVDMELDKGLIAQLKVKYPKKWKSLYTCYKEDDHLGYLQLLDESPLDSSIVPVSRKRRKQIKSDVKPKSDMAKEFAKL
ncbi:hypothetical protein [Kordia jejudonensis]|uniref:hypothetical protein n=1 Tax=Kordia jejudonensis TaxID=1348245 RepID=UPI000629CDC5|nr:hypothetical protein [Kordia jejudonensis]